MSTQVFMAKKAIMRIKNEKDVGGLATQHPTNP